MNRFQLEDFLLRNPTEDEVRDVIESDENITDFISNMYGGASNEIQDNLKSNHEIIDPIATGRMETYKPVVTRGMSKFEYVGAMTSLARYLKGLKSIAKYVDVVDCSTLVNPCELAFYLLDKGKMNVLFIRNRCEKVTFSELTYNKLWRDEVIDYFKKKNESMNEEFYGPLSAMVDSK